MQLQAIELETTRHPEASLIILHGLGADGSDFIPFCEQLDTTGLPPLRCVLPNAPVMPVSINGGHEMPAWYDILPTSDLARREDETGLRRAHQAINALIDHEVQRGIAPERIVLMGFSQGCAMALMTGLRYPHKLAGIVALSGYLPLAGTTEAERHAANQGTPIFMAHGTQDDVVPIGRGQAAYQELTRLGHAVQWHDYAMAHSLCLEEVQDINAWLQKVL